MTKSLSDINDCMDTFKSTSDILAGEMVGVQAAIQDTKKVFNSEVSHLRE